MLDTSRGKFLKYIVCVSLQAASLFALANDSAGYVATGGVQYIKNTNIEMLSEDLYISTKLIRVKYEFMNNSDTDIAETVLFPMPRVPIYSDSDYADTTGLISSFKIKVNGVSIKPNMHVRGFWEETDITAELKSCGLNDKDIALPYFNQGRDDDADLNSRIESCFDAMVNKGKIKPLAEDERPIWDAQVIYSWQQKFPANSRLKVEHEYQPLVGGATTLGIGDSEVKEFRIKENCIDGTFIQKLKKSKKNEASYSELGYVLTTGANWAKPIGKFHLTVDKSEPEQLISMCWDKSLKKTSPTRFEAFKTNFTPNRDIDIIFATPY